MKLFTKEIAKKLAENGIAAAAGNEEDRTPVVKLFCPWGAATWLLTETEVEIGDDDKPVPTGRLFGLCDLGMGFPEIGYVDIREITELRGPVGLKIERDMYFKATKTLGEYADEARAAGRIAA